MAHYKLEYRSIKPPRILQCGTFGRGENLIEHLTTTFREHNDVVALLHVSNLETEWYKAQCSNGARASRRLAERLFEVDRFGKETREIKVYIPKTESASE